MNKEDKIYLEKERKVIINELNRLKKQFSKVPKGSVFVRKINGKEYAYRTKRQNGRIIQKYLGPVGTKKVQNEINKAYTYKELKKEIIKYTKEMNKMNSKKYFKENLTEFAIGINKVDAGEPSPKAKKIIELFEEGILDFETTEIALRKLIV